MVNRQDIEHDALPSATSPKKIAANRRNARKSTGPRTPEGKRIARLNARRHGIFAHVAVLPGESAEEFDELRQALRRARPPRDLVDEAHLEAAALALWRKRRAVRAEVVSVRTARHETRRAARAARLRPLTWAQAPPLEARDDFVRTSVGITVLLERLTVAKRELARGVLREGTIGWLEMYCIGGSTRGADACLELAGDARNQPNAEEDGDERIEDARIKDERIEDARILGGDARTLDLIDRAQAYLTTELARLRTQRKELRARETERDKASAAGVMLPAEADQDRLRRYERACDREFERALRKLDGERPREPRIQVTTTIRAPGLKRELSVADQGATAPDPRRASGA
jgi:hypothetical protein